MTEFEIHEVFAKNGSPIIKINDYYVHSKYNPIKEAEKYVEKHYRPHNLQIIFGYGSGYLIDALLEFQKHDELILLIDPLLDRGEIQALKKHFNILNVKTADISCMEDILINLNTEVRTTFNIFCTNNYDKLFPEQYKELLQKIRNIQEANRVNDNTLVLFAEKWQENLAWNLNYMDKDASIEVLKKRYSAPVIIASSGPSLLKQLPILKMYREQVILISAGSTTNVLLKNDIKPDFIVTIDGGEANYNHFKNLTISESKLIYSFQNHPKIRKSFDDQAFICNLIGHAHVNNYVNEFLNHTIPELLAGSTVANLSFSVAQYISTGPIAFIGQDLAFTDNLSHVKGHNHVETINEDIAKKKELVQVEGYFGGKIMTSASMNSMRLAFERMILVQPPTNKFFNCTEGGAKIKGYEQLEFKTFCEIHISNKEQFRLRLSEKYPSIIESNIIIKQFKRDLEKAEKLVDLYESARSILNKDKSLNKFKASTLRKLDALDEEISPLLNELPVDHILMPTVLAVGTQYLEKHEETPNQKFDRVKKQNLKFYEGSLKAVKKFCTFVEKALENKEKECVDKNGKRNVGNY